MFEFEKLKEEHLELILNWRTEEFITKYMFTDVDYNMDKHKKWFEKISGSSKDKYWVIKVNNHPIGSIYLSDIDYQNKKTYWGFYIGDTSYRSYGGFVLPHLYDYVFYKMKFNKILAEVMDGNKDVVDLSLFYSSRLVGTYKNHIFKKKKFHDVHVLEMLKDTWDNSPIRRKKQAFNFEEWQ
jgi:UDP-4-amino-4,6-dideoxy-N-acetyl-beta-L-altrosamine N-acetyltransferase